MFVDAALAARIDQAEAALSRAIAEGVRASDPAASVEIRPLGGGLAVLARPRSPVNKAIGAGFEGPLDAAELDEVERVWAALEEPVRVELSTLASPEVAPQLTHRGYQLLGFENVLARPLAEVPAPPPGVVVESADADLDAWLRTVIDGFATPDGTGTFVDPHARDVVEAIMRDFADAAGFRRYTARVDGAIAGGATLRVDGDVALFCGATTLPAFRRRGVQAALLAARLADARDAGARLAVVTTSPGSASQKNVMRQGFALAYARAILVRGVRGNG